jgi:hypothetical protein
MATRHGMMLLLSNIQLRLILFNYSTGSFLKETSTYFNNNIKLNIGTTLKFSLLKLFV